MNVGGLFDGVGLLAFGLHLAGLEHRWLCESDPWRRGILEQRFPGVPIFDDVRAVGDGAPPVDVIAGGFPCKGASTAGKRNGFEHAETVLWREMARAVGELRPRFVLVENVANLRAVRGGTVWGEVVGDLAALGYDTVWDCLPAAAVGAPHLRDRVFAIATNTAREPERAAHDTAHAESGEREARQVSGSGSAASAPDSDCSRADAYAAAGGSRSTASERDQPSADPVGDTVRQQSEPESERGGAPVTGRRGQAAPDANEGRGSGGQKPDRTASGRQQVRSGDDTHGSGVPVGVQWGEYEPAIRRWEAAFAGPAPEPLLRGVDARPARRVVRSRLSALGDGVQVQVGFLVGRHLMSLDGEVAV